eukprot:163379-Ditylum_brightwellii.AAC.1
MTYFYPKDNKINSVWEGRLLLLVYSINNCNAWTQSQKVTRRSRRRTNEDNDAGGGGWGDDDGDVND